MRDLIFIAWLSLILSPSEVLSIPPQVVAVSPTPQSLTAPAGGEITILFDIPLDPTTISNSTIMIFGQWTGVMDGSFQMEDTNRLVRFIPSLSFSAGERILVSLSKGVMSSGGESLTVGYAWNFWTKVGSGSLDLVERTRIPVRLPGEGWIQTYGAYAGDLNGDGFHDFSVPNEVSNDVRVFLNDGTGNYDTFSIYPVPANSRPSTNQGADFNGDGVIDLAVGNSGSNTVSVFIGDGVGGYLPAVTDTVYSGPRGLSVMDLDGDGDMDIVTANRSGNNLSILPNAGDGTFGPRIPVEAGGEWETACATGDANEDGILDLFVGALGSEEIILLLGDGNGGLIPSTSVNCFGSPWMIVTGDVNGDGHVDVVSANSNTAQAAVILGDGQGNLLPPDLYPVGSFPIAIDLGDVDGDGDLDMVISSFSGTWTLYENDGSGTFINPRTFFAQAAASCAVFHDRDRDGDLDMTGIDEIDDLLYLFENVGLVGAEETAPPMADKIQKAKLFQNNPNPFYSRTHIHYQISSTNPESRNTSHVSLRVYDLTGSLVKTLVDERHESGDYSVQWEGLNKSDKRVPSGIYFYRLSSGNATLTRKFVLLR
ncbi:VCBS repeat-containing protein [candidate division TA06 bacterium]|nr:VCBS repeat-containing protein [candidate division TA06 bacterium]